MVRWRSSEERHFTGEIRMGKSVVNIGFVSLGALLSACGTAHQGASAQHASQPQPLSDAKPGYSVINELPGQGCYSSSHPCHRYRFSFEPGQRVVVRASSKTTGLTLSHDKAVLTAGPNEWIEYAFVADAYAAAFRIDAVDAETYAGAFRPDLYQLDISPRPTDVHDEPSDMRGAFDRQQATKQRVATETTTRKAQQTERSEKAMARTQTCTSNDMDRNVFWVSQDKAIVEFCDGTVLARSGSAWNMTTAGRGGQDYVRFMGSLGVNAQVASHNSAVLGTSESNQVKAVHVGRFEEASLRFEKKKRAETSRYAAKARAATK